MYTKEKVNSAEIIENMKTFIKKAKKSRKYPSLQSFCLEYNYTKQTIYAKVQRDKNIDNETSVAYWYDKLKTLQEYFVINNISEHNSPQCLLFLANNIHKLGKEEVNSDNATKLEIKLALLENDIKNFFMLARKENIDPTKKFVHLEGGRSGGKSEQVARYIILKALQREGKGTILCGREIQKSTDTSVKPLLERVINLYGLEAYFNITKKEIECLNNGVRIIFLGLKEASSDKSDTLKSTDLLFLAWIEEAQSISQLSLDKLLPTVARVDDYQIIFTYNRNTSQTIVYDYFLAQDLPAERRELTQHININYLDNKYNSPELLALAELDKQVNYNKYLHIWLGEPKRDYEGALWTYEEIKELNINISYDESNYVRRIVATDPATSSKDFNNEYGITVLGITKEGYVHLIEDCSKHYTASEYAKAVVRAYMTYNCEAIIYEENQGGEHIANTILSESKSVRLIPVRATQSKYLRALPVANLCKQGKIYFIKSFTQLENQMLLLTTQGYQGANGESPDRLDSFVWGCYELLNLKEANSMDVYFKKAWFEYVEDLEYKINNRVAYFSLKGSKVVYIKLDYYYKREGLDYHSCFGIRDIKVMEATENKDNSLFENIDMVIANDNEVIDFGNINVDRIEAPKVSLIELASNSLPYIQKGLVSISKEVENVIIDNVCQYIPEDVKSNIILEAILELLVYEKGAINE